MNIYTYFAAAMDCFESDLRINKHLQWNKNIIAGVPEGGFSLKEWNDFVHIVCDCPDGFATVESAKEYLIQHKAT